MDRYYCRIPIVLCGLEERGHSALVAFDPSESLSSVLLVRLVLRVLRVRLVLLVLRVLLGRLVLLVLRVLLERLVLLVLRVLLVLVAFFLAGRI